MANKLKLFASFYSEKNKDFDTVELHYSSLHILSGNQKWFCRIWDKDWIGKVRQRKKEFGESYGKNKFEAYRKAFKNLRS